MSTVYEINKGVNKPMEFRGLKAQYITFLAIGLVALLLLFAIAYIIGIPVYYCIGGAAILGYVLFSFVFGYSKKYGEHGLTKEAAYRKIPPGVRCQSRSTFLALQDTQHPSPPTDNTGTTK